MLRSNILYIAIRALRMWAGTRTYTEFTAIFSIIPLPIKFFFARVLLHALFSLYALGAITSIALEIQSSSNAKES